MGIQDREYVRQEGGAGGFARSIPRGPGFISVTAWLIIINVAVYAVGGFMNNLSVPVFQGYAPSAQADRDSGVPETVNGQAVYRGANGAVVTRDTIHHNRGASVQRLRLDPQTRQPIGSDVYTIMNPLSAFGHFSTYQGFLRLEVWRLVTFQFLHANLMHIVFNMLGLWIFGGIVEQYLGAKRYLAFYLVCGISGGLFYLLLNLIGSFGLPLPGALAVDLTTPLVGASAGVFGVIIACAYISPNTVVQLLFPPIPLKMKTFAYGYLAIVAVNLFLPNLTGGANQGGDAAHMGGALAGYFFIRRPHLLRDFFDVFNDSRKTSRAKRAPKGKRASPSDREVDRILDKVNTEGLHSLSEHEKKTLRQATEGKRG
ncbi:MAG: rhomboid family intramembrane serine protease [Phycisphaerales bacterium]